MQLRTIVVGVGFSSPSLEGGRWLARHFAPGARLVLVHSMEERWLPPFLDDEEVARLRSEARAHLSGSLAEAAEAVGAAEVDTVLREGRPSEVLVQVAEREGADLVAVGPHRRRSLVGSVLGSTASDLLARSSVPVLVAQGLPPGPPRRILVAVDAAGARGRTLRLARELRERFDARLRVLHVVEPPGVDVGTTLFSSTRDYEAARARVVERAQAWLQGILAEAGLEGEAIRAISSYGTPEVEITSAAERLESELIVVGNRGRGRAQAYALGSVARAVIEAAGCPVLVIPPEPE